MTKSEYVSQNLELRIKQLVQEKSDEIAAAQLSCQIVDFMDNLENEAVQDLRNQWAENEDSSNFERDHARGMV